MTVSWQELGINLPEVNTLERRYLKRADKSVGEGGKRKILEVMQHDGDYATMFERLNKAEKLERLGPKRFELYEQGKVGGLKDFLDSNGDLILIKNLPKPDK